MGRSIGSLLGKALNDRFKSTLSQENQAFYQYELSGVISSACLAHDVGNPAFGHSGEKAIANYFETHKDTVINGKSLSDHFSPDEWKDLTHFEGNANALRLLTRQFKGRLGGGQRLMYVTLASIIKYPCHSGQINKQISHFKKFGYFHSDKESFLSIMREFNLLQPDGTARRHPFVYMVEAADDICYRIIDMEDAHRIGILSREYVEHTFLCLLDELEEDIPRTKDILARLSDDNEAIAYLRTKCINGLVQQSVSVFMSQEEAILSGSFTSTLIDEVEKTCPYLKEIQKKSVERIYNHSSVIEVELAGYNVMSELLSVFMTAVLNEQRRDLDKKSIHLISPQFNLAYDQTSPYEKALGVLDFVSGMTDGYATELYRKLKGIDIPAHK